MIEGWSFVNKEWLWPALLLGGIVFAVFIWKERSKYPSSKFYFNLFVSLLVIASLYFIAVKPQREIPKYGENLILLTENYNESRLDSLKRAYKGIKVATYAPGPSFLMGETAPENLFILGKGVADYDFWQLDSIRTHFIPDTTFSGITRLKYDTKAILGSVGVFNIEYRQGKLGTKIYLEDSGKNKLDSVTLNGRPIEFFQLSTQFKTVGSSLYSIAATDSLGVLISRDPFPMSVEEKKGLKVWMVNDIPSFETKYLKNYLTDLGYKLTVRSRLTRGKFKYEYFNQSERQGIVFNEEQLAKIDLLIMDAISFQNLSRNARNKLEVAIREGGLGVFIQPDAAILNANFPIANFRFNRTSENTLRLPKWPRTSITTYGLSFNADARTEPVVSNNERVYIAYMRIGAGRIGTSTLNGTFDLILNGNAEVYQHIWSTALQNIGKGFTPTAEIETHSFPAYADEPLHFTIRTPLTDPLPIINDSIRIALKQDYLNQRLWWGRFYPGSTGWHTVKLNKDSLDAHQIYVSNSVSWKTIRSFKTLAANKRYFENSEVIETKEGTTYEPISLLVFYILALLGMGYLWLEPKL